MIMEDLLFLTYDIDWMMIHVYYLIFFFFFLI